MTFQFDLISVSSNITVINLFKTRATLIRLNVIKSQIEILLDNEETIAWIDLDKQRMHRFSFVINKHYLTLVLNSKKARYPVTHRDMFEFFLSDQIEIFNIQGEFVLDLKLYNVYLNEFRLALSNNSISKQYATKIVQVENVENIASKIDNFALSSTNQQPSLQNSKIKNIFVDSTTIYSSWDSHPTPVLIIVTILIMLVFMLTALISIMVNI